MQIHQQLNPPKHIIQNIIWPQRNQSNIMTKLVDLPPNPPKQITLINNRSLIPTIVAEPSHPICEFFCYIGN
jgi:hypothetical protein